MIVLGLESSCDETAAAIVRDDRVILANSIAGQIDLHKPYGGVVPEVAARAHLERLDALVEDALTRANLGLTDIDAVAATGGPGLIGGVIVGVTTGKAIAAVTGKPFIAVNHLEGHALTARLTHGLEFPYLLLLVSGGHCQFLAVEGVGKYERLGATIDDAAGEAFDKAARMLGLGYPGGPAIQREAAQGDPTRFALPRPMKGRKGCDLSFSGLKNALRLQVAGLGAISPGTISPGDRADLAASFQAAMADSLAERTAHAMEMFAELHPEASTFLVVAGGVAANIALRQALDIAASASNFSLIAPPPALCTDNGAMIAWAGIERMRLGLTNSLDFAPRPRWPLDPRAAPLRGAGVKA